MTIAEKIYTKLIDALESGKAVAIATHTKYWHITPKTYLKFKAANHPLFKMGKNNCLYMAEGKGYSCISYADMPLAQIKVGR